MLKKKLDSDPHSVYISSQVPIVAIVSKENMNAS